MDLIKWLLEGDVSIQYQTYRDLLNEEKPELRNRIETEGFGKMLLEKQKPDGHFGGGYYVYKWINTHYSLMELRRLNIKPPKSIIDICNEILITERTKDGGCTPNPQHWEFSDVCINGMLLHSFCYFGIEEEKLKDMVDMVLTQHLPDGGFNCFSNDKRYTVKHSSLHTSVSVLEGFNTYLNEGYTYREDEIKRVRKYIIEFILIHRLYKSDKTGEIINPNFIKLSYPPRYKYDILRALDAMREAGISYDPRMYDAFQVLKKKRRKDGTWPVQNKHAGKVHFDMEKIGGPSRWNTLRVLRVLKHFSIEL